MPVAIRTRDLLLRRQTLYPAELRAHTCMRLNIVSFNYFAIFFEGKNEKKLNFIPLKAYPKVDFGCFLSYIAA